MMMRKWIVTGVSLFLTALVACGGDANDCPCALITLGRGGRLDDVAFDAVDAKGTLLMTASTGPLTLPQTVDLGVGSVKVSDLAMVHLRAFIGTKVVKTADIDPVNLSFDDKTKMLFVDLGTY